MKMLQYPACITSTAARDYFTLEPRSSLMTVISRAITSS
jgi:hypothetical protein